MHPTRFMHTKAFQKASALVAGNAVSDGYLHEDKEHEYKESKLTAQSDVYREIPFRPSYKIQGA